MDTFNLCQVPQNSSMVNDVINFVNGALGTMAMVNYPYGTSFIFPMPAWPVNVSCDVAMEVNIQSDNDYLVALQKATDIYYNYNDWRSGACLDLYADDSGGLDDDGWSVLYCNEMVMPFAQSGVSDMFLPPQTWDQQETTLGC